MSVFPLRVGMGPTRRGEAGVSQPPLGSLEERILPCPGRRINPSTGQHEFCGVMLPAGRVKRCEACRLQAQQERRLRFRLARWLARPDRGTFPLGEPQPGVIASARGPRRGAETT